MGYKRRHSVRHFISVLLKTINNTSKASVTTTKLVARERKEGLRLLSMSCFPNPTHGQLTGYEQLTNLLLSDTKNASGKTPTDNNGLLIKTKQDAAAIMISKNQLKTIPFIFCVTNPKASVSYCDIAFLIIVTIQPDAWIVAAFE
ncbi:unnamed protein product [Rotaria socialis]|uniref:Uncharacterized protein n=1 Tax=Rotaria socialis TaxID=392032 RepID=A0A820JZR4_9BILA|nr:unnamed protein product [Rotaria socialis]